jgi:indolepyruvate ferredoxin oxidoreductase alpha subunit
MEGYMNGLGELTDALLSSAECFFGVPGYPATEIVRLTSAECCSNEKVALEYSLGSSLSGRRAAVIMKNAGINACADTLINSVVQGLKSGVVLVVADDTEISGSQNALDSRYYGEISSIPVIEPDNLTIAEGTEEAFRASEKFSRPVLLRVTPALLDGPCYGTKAIKKVSYGEPTPSNLTMRGRVTRADNISMGMQEWSDNSKLNILDKMEIGVGAAEGEGRIVTVYPTPRISMSGEIRINELGRHFVREHTQIRKEVAVPEEPETFADRGFYRTFCPSCPFRNLFTIIYEKGFSAISDAGCSLLAMNPPYSFACAHYGLGSSPAVAARSTGICLTGDYAIMHSGINALIDIREKGIPLLCIILKNMKMGMTGGQEIMDIERYLQWSDPVVCEAEDSMKLKKEIVQPDSLKVVIVRGECPVGERYGTIEC